ncbi:MAG: hypothetical protein A3C27_03090 [Candidatus Levybacteria bacterium RIFCSPHIGHO2_02_FULL_39_36]|nr:MAG: hydroxyacid dehydrogenase [Candidatus Levybacteria bacterium GW2011_GWA1_39_11]KKR49951.1 MAG: hydroxyacid dehydrogenase [Candidatus Levybacteria bacterium GW2011_GWA2_40_16]OGH14193.1 MAG: hypothetical protein A2689_01105 [Candidatus Levybacteria bacterium RIFCSPHIGHO2_01_FULL_38_96]OGH25820.1 MAG: hypothetical protein A3E68_01645 [Candidatus Levybacteria bacterium RIFCSPHIGHO2_12_FULL_39_39]OGH28531.1 MAG: hypothetical protein A3C27_03090 [Candidatus Levybacteria bacterium RIFCSPHIGHO
MKIVGFELQDWEQEYLKKKFSGALDISLYSDKLSLENLENAQDADGIVIFIYSKLDRDILDKMPKLKFITTMSTGFDHIDIEECKRRNIVVSTVPSYGENTVAEHTFALIFAISRRIIESHERVREGNFSPTGLTGFDLFGKTLGVIGVGNIGRHVVRIAKGVGMEVLGYEKHENPKVAEQLGFRFVDLDTLLSESDVITLHLPLLPETEHFLNEAKFEKMKKGVVIINTSRGAIIDTRALIGALDCGKVGACGLDVLEGEPLLHEEKELFSKRLKKEDIMVALEDRMLFERPNVLITPHNAFNSREALMRILKTTEENIYGFLSGNPKNPAF